MTLTDYPAAARASTLAWPEALKGIAFGGDYNPEQWPEEVWDEDIHLMGEAGVSLVSVGIFSWVMFEPEPGVFRFDWFDRLLDKLHAAGIAVDLATPTAAPPSWFYYLHPEAWVVDADGRRLGPGSRGMCSPNSPAYQEASARITTALAQRYGHHPAVVMWHVHNEYGAPVAECHSHDSQHAFRHWLKQRYGSLDRLNEAWGTTFWGQLYGKWEEVRTPGSAASVINPAQRLDFARFSDDVLLQCFIRERDIIRQYSPSRPITTNFMATSCPSVNYWRWSREVDLVSNDHYLTAVREDAHILLSMDADLTRSLAGNRPWMLMEHSTSAVNWQPYNLAKSPGELARNSLAHVARGADGVLYFQWRAARRGAEKFHSAMLPHGGTSTRIWQELKTLGTQLDELAQLKGSTNTAHVAILWDWESFWAQDLEWRPSIDLNHRERIEAFYTQLWRDKIAVDFAHPESDLSHYKLVIAPQLYLMSAPTIQNLNNYTTSGGHLLISYFSGIVDEEEAIHQSGVAFPLTKLLGITLDEFAPLRPEQSVSISLQEDTLTGDVWTDRFHAQPGTKIIASYLDGPATGGPAITRKDFTTGGTAWYLSTRLTQEGLKVLLDLVYKHAGITPERNLPEDLEIVSRHLDHTEYRFYINHSSTDATVQLPEFTELLTGPQKESEIQVPGGEVRIVKMPHSRRAD